VIIGKANIKNLKQGIELIADKKKKGRDKVEPVNAVL
jgi:hypothetical protein